MTNDLSPMGYFDSKNAKQLAEESQEDLLNHIQEIVGFPELKSYLYSLTDMSKFHELRAGYGLGGGDAEMPDVLILAGGGDKKEASRHLSKHYRKMKKIKSSAIYRANINDYIYSYISYAREALDKLFKKAKGATVVFNGFEELIRNPRPPICDWHDWDDVLCDLLSRSIGEEADNSCIMLSMSQKTHEHIAKCYPKFRKLNRKIIPCPRYSANEMVQRLEQEIREDGYILDDNALHRLSNIFEQVANHEVKVRDECVIASLFNKILSMQKQRLSQISIKHLCVTHLKSIKCNDIPSLSIPVDRDNVIYL